MNETITKAEAPEILAAGAREDAEQLRGQAESIAEAPFVRHDDPRHHESVAGWQNAAEETETRATAAEEARERVRSTWRDETPEQAREKAEMKAQLERERDLETHPWKRPTPGVQPRSALGSNHWPNLEGHTVPQQPKTFRQRAKLMLNRLRGKY